MENLPIQCEEEEDQDKENVEDVDEKKSKDENGIMRIVDVVDKCSFGITTEFKKDECSNGKVLVNCPRDDDELIQHMNSLVLENPSIQDKEKEVEEEVDHEVEGEEFADKVATNHSIELIVENEEYVFSNGDEHVSPSIQNELHVHQEEEEEGETEQPHYEEEVDKESSSKVECLSIKLIGEQEEDELSTQEHFSLKTLAAEDKQVHSPTEFNSHSDGSYGTENQQVNSGTNEDGIERSDGQQSPSITSKEEGEEQCLDCSIDTREPIRLLNMMQLDEFERSDDSPNERTAHDELISEQEQEHKVRNEVQEELRNAYVKGDEKMNLKAEEVKVVYGVYGSKDRALLEMVTSVLVGLLLVFLCHIFAKSSSVNPF